MPQLSQIAPAVKAFGGDPQRAGPLAQVLGFEPIPSPLDILSGRATPLSRFVEARYGVHQLYRVGTAKAQPASVGLYVAVLQDWGDRSSDRDRARRRVARALVDMGQDARSLFFLVPNDLSDRAEAELVLPRTGAGTTSESSTGISTVRALIDLREPTRFHRELLLDLSIAPSLSLASVSQQWQKAFSVEQATKTFYHEYQGVRDHIADAMTPANPEHSVIRGLSEAERKMWATRQLGRILFLWFLQSKRWLGYENGADGSTSYLIDLWQDYRRSGGGYYLKLLVPLFFEAMAERRPGDDVRALLGNMPYLNGGLFRRNALEDRIDEGGAVSLPDDLFDPDEDDSALGLLSRYRFTTRESTPDDQSVDPDPELLGRVFENLYQGDERHDSGTYYTPREIVHFMCRQVLDGYLGDETGITQEQIDHLRKQVSEPDELRSPLAPDMEQDVIAALENVRVCDPAVGSGAFLLGMIQEIVLLRRGILYTHHDSVEDEDRQVEAWTSTLKPSISAICACGSRWSSTCPTPSTSSRFRTWTSASSPVIR